MAYTTLVYASGMFQLGTISSSSTRILIPKIPCLIATVWFYFCAFSHCTPSSQHSACVAQYPEIPSTQLKPAIARHVSRKVDRHAHRRYRPLRHLSRNPTTMPVESNGEHSLSKTAAIPIDGPRSLSTTFEPNSIEASITLKGYLMCAFAAFRGLAYPAAGTLAAATEFVIPASRQSLIVSISVGGNVLRYAHDGRPSGYDWPQDHDYYGMWCFYCGGYIAGCE
jgi:hypothetical protein